MRRPDAVAAVRGLRSSCWLSCGCIREDFFVRRPQLVIVPLSTLPNWEREFKTWAPQLNVVSFVGNGASRAVIKKHEFYTPAEAGADQCVAPGTTSSALADSDVVFSHPAKHRGVARPVFCIDTACGNCFLL